MGADRLLHLLSSPTEGCDLSGMMDSVVAGAAVVAERAAEAAARGPSRRAGDWDDRRDETTRTRWCGMSFDEG